MIKPCRVIEMECMPYDEEKITLYFPELKAEGHLIINTKDSNILFGEMCDNMCNNTIIDFMTVDLRNDRQRKKDSLDKENAQ